VAKRIVKIIKLTTDKSGELELEKIVPFQGKIKNLDSKMKSKLRTSILKQGFTFPLFIWKNTAGKNYCIDGHQRITVLQELKKEGYFVPKLPVFFIKARTSKEAKIKLLSAESKYGKLQVDELNAFIEEARIDLDGMSTFEFPEFNLEQITMHLGNDWQIEKEKMQNDKRIHILFSFHPDLFSKIEPHLKKIIQIKGVEYEQSTNQKR